MKIILKSFEGHAGIVGHRGGSLPKGVGNASRAQGTRSRNDIMVQADLKKFSDSLNYHQMHDTSGGTDDWALEQNRAMLREGVVGVECVYSGNAAGAGFPTQVKNILGYRLNPDEQLGSIEVYANGVVNAFVRVNKRTGGTWDMVRSDGKDYYVDGFFKFQL